MNGVEFLNLVKAGDEAGVMAELSRDPGLIYSKNDDGLSAVLLAVYYGHASIAHMIADKGKILDLYEACALGDLPRVQELTASDPGRVNSFSLDGFQPLGLACFFGHTTTAAYLLSQGAEIDSPSRNPLHVVPVQSAAAGGHIAITRMLLEAGAQPNAREAGGYTPLHAAAQAGEVEMVKLLLQFGADNSLKSKDGKTAFDIAQQYGHVSLLDFLRPAQ